MNNNYIQHAGVKGMKWGVRRYQNKDGSLTPAGKKRYDQDGDNVNKTKSETSDSVKRERVRTKGKTATAAALGVVGGLAISAIAAYAGARALWKKLDLDNGLFGNGW